MSCQPTTNTTTTDHTTPYKERVDETEVTRGVYACAYALLCIATLGQTAGSQLALLGEEGVGYVGESQRTRAVTKYASSSSSSTQHAQYRHPIQKYTHDVSPAFEHVTRNFDLKQGKGNHFCVVFVIIYPPTGG